MADDAPTGADLDRDFGGAQELLDEFLFFSVGIDGIIIDRNIAQDPAYPCRCVEITKSNGQHEPFCFKKGVIGTLDQAQVGELCKERIPLKHPEGLTRRIQEFERASAACKGMPIETRLECMSEALRKNGVTWGLGKTR